MCNGDNAHKEEEGELLICVGAWFRSYGGRPTNVVKPTEDELVWKEIDLKFRAFVMACEGVGRLAM